MSFLLFGVDHWRTSFETARKVPATRPTDAVLPEADSEPRMSQPLVDPSELERLLGQLLTPGTEAIRESEEALRRALGQPQFVVDLFAQLQHSSLPQVR